MHSAAWIDATTGGLQASWSRKLDTGDANDAVIYPGVLTEVAFVIGNQPFFSLHGNSEEGGAAHTQLNFFESKLPIPSGAVPAGTVPTGVPVPPPIPTSMPTAQTAMPAYMVVGIVMGVLILAFAIGGYVWTLVKRRSETNFAGGKLLQDVAPLSDVRFVPQQLEEGGAYEQINVYSQPYAPESAPEQVYQPPRPQSSSNARGQQQMYEPRGASQDARSSQRSHSPRGRSVAASDAYSINGSAGQAAAPRSPIRMHSPARSNSRKF
jgi:hypothetical protein